MWSDERDLIMDLLEENQINFPAKCPCCGKIDGHVFFYKPKNSEQLGSAWVWCGSCKEYSHSRHVVPAWWVNMDSIELSQLHARPDNLNDIKEIIDKWVNECASKTAGEKTIVD